MNSLAEEIIAGRRLGSREEALPLVEAELEALCRGADRIRSALCGSRADLCTIVNGRSGQCGEDCKFCAQSCLYRTQAEEYPFLAEDEILAACRRDEAAGARRFSIVTAGRSLKGEDLERALSAYRRLRRETGVELCASHGLQTQEEFERMKAAGVDPTHTYQDKVDNIRRAQAAGLDVCSGGILGMGETWEDRIDMALDLAALGIGSIPLNILRPIPGTPFGDLEPITNEEVLRAVAIFRYLNPTAWIRMAAGRGQFSGGGAELFRSGANAAITGDMLTTTGTSMAGDAAMFRALGYQL